MISWPDANLSVAPGTREQAERISNDPDVFPQVAFGEDAIVINDDALCLDGDGCSFVFYRQQPGFWHLHSLSLPSHRGRGLLRASKDAARFMFTHTDCTQILTVTPKDNPQASPPKSFGFKHWFERDEWMSRRGAPVGADFYRLDVFDWVSRSRDCEKWGHWFHSALEEAKADQPLHDDDAAHDRSVGASAMCMAQGQIAKGLFVYNTWANFAGYHPIIQIKDDLFFTGDAYIRRHEHGMEIEQCL